MAIQVIQLPQVGESVTEGIVNKWLKRVGDHVEKYDQLLEVVTDKITMEMPCPVSGILKRILVQEGTSVPMGSPIAEIETEDAIHNPVASSSESTGSRIQVKYPRMSAELIKGVRPVGPTGGGIEHEDGIESRSGSQARRGHSPVVMKMASQHKIDLAQVLGTGIEGRITKRDVERYLATNKVDSIEQRQVEQSGPTYQYPTTNGEDEIIRLTPVRRIISDNMVKSMSRIPHAWSMVEVDVTGLVQLRDSIKNEFRHREGVDLTYLPFAIKSVSECLKEHRIVNSTWGSDKIILRNDINTGIAVAADEGLVVPVIIRADTYTITELAHLLNDIIARARKGKLKIEEVQGATFTINNTGALGSVISRPIIPYPQAAILTTEAIVKRPVVINDVITVRSIMNMGLSFDHRILDGFQVALFLNRVKRTLETYESGTIIR